MMPFGDVAAFAQQQVVTDAEIRARIEGALGLLTLLDEGRLDGEARRYRLPGAPGTIGLISSVTVPFCASCNRAHLTADGMLRLCLLRDGEINRLQPLRQGASLDDLKQLIRENVWMKPSHSSQTALAGVNRQHSNPHCGIHQN